MNIHTKAADNLGANSAWLEKELRHVNFKDKRLATRLFKTSNFIESKASGSINQSCRKWKDAKGAYRLFSNKKVDVSEIYSSHYKETLERISGQECIFSVQDTTYLDFDSHAKTKDLGSISKAYTKHQMGLIVHSALAVTKDGVPLGLTSQQCFTRPIREETPKEKQRRKYLTNIKDKESYKWITSLKETIQNTKGIQVITIGDMEADIFALMLEAEEFGTLFLVRARKDRTLIDLEPKKTTTIHTAIKESIIKHRMTLQIP